MFRYAKALKTAVKAHKGQRDKGGHPYILHPIRVSQGVKSQDAKVVALLHDVLEDTDYTLNDLKFLSRKQKRALILLTHDKDVPYMEYIRRIKTNKIAREVKLSDLKQNANLTRLNKVTTKDLERAKKYLEAIKILSEPNRK